jgi:hypothetical protein
VETEAEQSYMYALATAWKSVVTNLRRKVKAIEALSKEAKEGLSTYSEAVLQGELRLMKVILRPFGIVVDDKDARADLPARPGVRQTRSFLFFWGGEWNHTVDLSLRTMHARRCSSETENQRQHFVCRGTRSRDLWTLKTVCGSQSAASHQRKGGGIGARVD